MLMYLRCFKKRLDIRFRAIFLALVILTMIGILVTFSTNSTDVRNCFMDHPMVSQQYEERQSANDGSGDDDAIELAANQPQRLPDILLADNKPTPGRSIFFHETTCHLKQSKHNHIGAIFGNNEAQPSVTNFVQLTARQACAVESAALHSPNFSVFVLFASPTYYNNSTLSDPIIEALLSYSNVHLRNLNLWTYAAGTPIYEWFKDGELFKSRYVLSHISDFLRYLTLWRWGGTYLDMDVVVIRSMEDVPPNYTGAESATAAAAGVMNFSPTGFGHEVAEMCLRDFQKNFNGNDWGNNGPGVITRVMAKVCGTKNIAFMMMQRKRCMGFQVFEPSAFYAIPWREWERFFEAQYLESTMQSINQSYVIHVWNNLSKTRRIKVGSNAAYSKLAEIHCPKVFKASDMDELWVLHIENAIVEGSPTPKHSQSPL